MTNSAADNPRAMPAVPIPLPARGTVGYLSAGDAAVLALLLYGTPDDPEQDEAPFLHTPDQVQERRFVAPVSCR